MFRRELQTFVARLQVAEARLSDLLEYLFQWNKQTGENSAASRTLEQYMRQAVEARRPKVSELSAMSQKDLKLIDEEGLQNAIESFLRNEYSYFQSAIFDFNAAAKVTFANSEHLKTFFAHDRECLHRLGDLKASPRATILRTAPDELMASGRNRTWGVP